MMRCIYQLGGFTVPTYILSLVAVSNLLIQKWSLRGIWKGNNKGKLALIT